MLNREVKTPNNQPWFIAAVFSFFDLLLMNSIFWAFTGAYKSSQESVIPIVCVIINVTWGIIACVMKIYDVEYLLERKRVLRMLLSAISFHLLFCTFSFYVFSLPISRLFLMEFYIVFIVSAALMRLFYSKYLIYLNNNGYIYRKMIIIGGGKEARCLKSHIESKRAFGVQFLGFIDNSKHENELDENYFLGELSSVEEILKKKNPDELYWTLPLSDEEDLHNVINICEKNLIHFHAVPNYLAYPFKNLNVFYYGGIPVMHFRTEPLESSFNRRVKRVFDILFSLAVIIFVLSWLVPLLAVIIKLDSPGPVFFLQKRTGRNNKDFDIIKFRTMTVNSTSDTCQATRGDTRVTAIGAFLRKTSIDELPQFFNSFIGNMSVVGPRPHMLQHTREYAKIIEPFMVRHHVKSGITGWAQVNGARGETDVVEKMERRVELDVWYLENWSLFLDIKICIQTIWVAFVKGDDAY